MIGEKAVLRLLGKLVQASPADQTEALLLTEDSSLTRFAQSDIHQHVAEKNGILILRVVLGKKVAVITTNLLHPSSLAEALQRAISLAKIQRPNEAFVSLPAPKPLPKIDTFFENVDHLTPVRRAKTVKELLSLAKEKGCSASGAFSVGKVEVAAVNSLGVEAYQSYSDVFLHMIAENRKNSGYASFVSRDAEQLDIEAFAEEATRKVSRDEAIQVEAGEYEVVLEPYAVGELLSFLGSLGFHAMALQEGRSFLCGRLGEKMVDSSVTVYDDGLDPGGLQAPFDFEGLPKQKVTFFENGVARGVTYDSFTANREGKDSTGHGLIAPNTEGPIPINLFMEAGQSSLENLVASVRKGIYVSRFHYTNVVEPMKTVITGMTRDGTFLIEGGEIKAPIKNLRFTESVLKALSRVSAISRERRICSEGTGYSRRFVTGVVVPALKVDGFNFSGVSAL
jgi:predicted Zn-dependent protease